MDKFIKKWKSTTTQLDVQTERDEVTTQPDVPISTETGRDEVITQPDVQVVQPSQKRPCEVESTSRQLTINVDFSNLKADPGLRKPISEYHPNVRDAVRRAYLLKGPCQPRPNEDELPKTFIRDRFRCFQISWYDDFESWLEYSTSKDGLFCLYCYLFRPDHRAQGSGGTFVKKGFVNWDRKDKVRDHATGLNSAHNQAFLKGENLKNQNQSVQTAISQHSTQSRKDYQIHLTGVTDAVLFLLRQGLAFRGNDESETSSNRGNYLELLGYTCKKNEEFRRVFDNASRNLQLVSSDIQKDVVRAASIETTNAILKDYGNALFSILIDEAREVFVKEQIALVLCYVDKQGCVVERFLGVIHVAETNSKSLKNSIDALFAKHGLSIERLRGQGCDGVSNMQGDLNGPKTLVLKENECAFYIHCFAHQLQLALVAVSKKVPEFASLFSYAANIVNVVFSSCKRRDKIREKRALEVKNAFENDEIQSGRGLNQETSLTRLGDTRWSSHYGTLISLILMFSSVLEVLKDVSEDGLNAQQRGEAFGLLGILKSFDFILSMCFMKNLLAISNDLCKALQHRDQDIVNAMDLVKHCKDRIQEMRDNGWDSLFEEASLLCLNNGVDVPEMDGKFRKSIEGRQI